jgi:serine/threonine protein kinase
MPLDSVDALVQAIRQCNLLEAPQLQEVVKLQPRCPDARTLAQEAIRRGLLTRFQAHRLIQGRGAELVFASYVLLDRLGEGGMGTVYKGRHQTMGRIVAVKVIRKDRLANAEAVKRFRREIQATAQLSHPNVVSAYDAGQEGEMHYFTMEYVDGIDLGRLLKQNGQMPVREACDAIRQGALGLQHAFEKGMVHRDIKPANLLRGRQGGIVKLLDLGLARLENDEVTKNLTQIGKIVGTVDYIAPEQALDSRSVDVRADIYSLGCTFYHLLAGHVPHPEGNTYERLARHRWEEPTPVERVRTEVPADVAMVIRKMMAKKAEDRFQTPPTSPRPCRSIAAPVAVPTRCASRWPPPRLSDPTRAALCR